MGVKARQKTVDALLQFKKDEPVASQCKKKPEKKCAEDVNQVYQ
jgi:hypothetical protein